MFVRHPNPTSGFVMMFKASDLVYLDMKVEEVLKYIISCGVVMTRFKTVTPPEEAQAVKEEEQTPEEEGIV